ncbi:hypothetical protein VTJ83DRAFT_2010 [Remersonia thermophila]|uniref:Protein phosphatase n=1 Tax=Remersonia thermophila TaxID=72144 RepID=A0ABR4DJ15_9PEZI
MGRLGPRLLAPAPSLSPPLSSPLSSSSLSHAPLHRLLVAASALRVLHAGIPIARSFSTSFSSSSSLLAPPPPPTIVSRRPPYQRPSSPWRRCGSRLPQRQARSISLTPRLSQDASRRQPPSVSEPEPEPEPTPAPSSQPPEPPLPSSPPLDSQGRLDASVFSHLPFRFDTGVALFAKRTPRPFPPPFLSPPSSSFTDPLSTHDRSRDRRAYVDGHPIQGLTNGDDAVFESAYFIGANDGVGAWSTRPRGHAGLWARLILHFWATSIFEDAARQGKRLLPDPLAHLQRAYEQTIEATGPPNDWQGTTTATGAQLHYRRVPAPPPGGGGGDDNPGASHAGPDPEATAVVEPLLYVTNLGDSQIMVIRPSTREIVYKSAEQWHWFDCPRQLGTNSPDTPRGSAVVDEVPIREGDVVLAMSDGVIDNLWAHEIAAKVAEAMERWGKGEGREFRRRHCYDEPQEGAEDGEKDGGTGDDGMMEFVADEVMEAARAIAVDPFAESPFMEHAIEEGLASGGGKLDDISVVAALCKSNKKTP